MAPPTCSLSPCHSQLGSCFPNSLRKHNHYCRSCPQVPDITLVIMGIPHTYSFFLLSIKNECSVCFHLLLGIPPHLCLIKDKAVAIITFHFYFYLRIIPFGTWHHNLKYYLDSMWPSSFPFNKHFGVHVLSVSCSILKAWAFKIMPLFYSTIPSNNLCQIHQLIGVYVANFIFLKSLHLTEGLFAWLISLCLETLLSFGFRALLVLLPDWLPSWFPLLLPLRVNSKL